jgi:hypothetical protein
MSLSAATDGGEEVIVTYVIVGTARTVIDPVSHPISGRASRTTVVACGVAASAHS